MPTADHDNPVLAIDGSRKTYLKGETCGNDAEKKGSDRNSEPKNGVFFVPVSPSNHSYIVSNVPEKNTNALRNGVNAKPEKEYDPYEHYVGKHLTTYLDSVFHYMKVGMGAGVLAMPDAFHNAGWLLGTILTFGIGVLCTYTIHMLVQSEYELCKRRKLPYLTQAETVEYAFKEGPQCLRWFAPYGKFLANFFMVVYQLGSSAIYIVFIARNFKQVHDTYCEDEIYVRLMIVYLVVPLVLIGWVRTLKMLAPFSTIADIAVLASFGLIFMYTFRDLPSLSERQAIGSIRRGVPLFFGTVMFAMEAIGVVMPLKNSMREPRRFGGSFGVVNTSMVPIMLLYAFLGFFGYLKYGDHTEASITLNLPKNEILADISKIMHSSSMYISYALSNFIIFDVVWTNGMKARFTGQRYKIVWEYAVRSGIALITIVMAITIPDLETFISLTGSFCLSVLGLAVPAVVHSCTYWNDRSNPLKFAWLQFRNVLLLLLAVFAFVAGVSTAIIQYINKSKL